MFGLSKKVDYGLELLLFLAKQSSQRPMALRLVAKTKKLPLKSLEQVAIPLRNAGLVGAKEGRGGGYFLAQKAKDISVAEVVEILEGPVMLGACFGCPKVSACGQKDVWAEVGEKVRKTIEGKTLADLIKKK